MELIINIDEKYYKSIKKQGGFSTATFQGALLQAIVDGTPLPKGHGRLVDVDKLFRHCGIRDYNCCGDCDKCDYYVVSVNDIREAKTIIEADKENYGE